MLESLEAKIIALGVLGAMLLGAYMAVHHQGAMAQKAKDSARITSLQASLRAAGDQLRIDAGIFRQIESNAQAEQAKSAAQQRAGVAAVAKAKRDAEKAAEAETAWQKKFEAASKSAPCAQVLREHVCAAVFEN